MYIAHHALLLQYERRILFCAPIVDTLLEGLSTNVAVPDQNQLHRVLPLRQALSAFGSATTNLLHAIDALLQVGLAGVALVIWGAPCSRGLQRLTMCAPTIAQDDDEMAKMCLKYQRQLVEDERAGVVVDPEEAKLRLTYWVTEMEMLLQTYHAKLSEINGTIKRLLYSIESAQDMM